MKLADFLKTDKKDWTTESIKEVSVATANHICGEDREDRAYFESAVWSGMELGVRHTLEMLQIVTSYHNP